MEKEVLKERLTKLVEIGLSKNKTLDFNDVNDFFAGETLTPEELEFVYTYLERKKIDVLRAATEDMAADDFDKDIDFSDDEEDVDLDAIDLLRGYRNGGSGPYVFKGDRYSTASYSRGGDGACKAQGRGG